MDQVLHYEGGDLEKSEPGRSGGGTECKSQREKSLEIRDISGVLSQGQI